MMMYLPVILAALTVAALILAELFFIPGFGFLGILGGGGFIAAEAYFITMGLYPQAILFGALSIATFAIGFLLLSRNKFIKKMELTDTVDEVAIKLPEGIFIGAKGIAVSRLALGGTIRIGDNALEGESEEGFIDENERIIISDIRNQKVYVRRDSSPFNASI